MRRVVTVLLLLAALLPVACARETALPLDRDTFVQVMVSLRRASEQSSDPAEFETRKAAILQRAGVTEAELREYGRLAPRDARALVEAYDSIAEQLQGYHEPE